MAPKVVCLFGLVSLSFQNGSAQCSFSQVAFRIMSSLVILMNHNCGIAWSA